MNAGWITHIARRGGRRITHYFAQGSNKSMCNRVERTNGELKQETTAGECCAICATRKGDMTTYKHGKVASLCHRIG